MTEKRTKEIASSVANEKEKFNFQSNGVLTSTSANQVSPNKKEFSMQKRSNKFCNRLG